MQDHDHRNAIDRLPDDLRDDDAVEYHAFADVPGTTLTLHFTEDADAFDVSRVVSLVDGHGYDLDRMGKHDLRPECPECRQGVDDVADGYAGDAGYWCRKCRVFLYDHEVEDRAFVVATFDRGSA